MWLLEKQNEKKSWSSNSELIVTYVDKASESRKLWKKKTKYFETLPYVKTLTFAAIASIQNTRWSNKMHFDLKLSKKRKPVRQEFRRYNILTEQIFS